MNVAKGNAQAVKEMEDASSTELIAEISGNMPNTAVALIISADIPLSPNAKKLPGASRPSSLLTQHSSSANKNPQSP
jgi:hypothetical protein